MLGLARRLRRDPGNSHSFGQIRLIDRAQVDARHRLAAELHEMAGQDPQSNPDSVHGHIVLLDSILVSACFA